MSSAYSGFCAIVPAPSLSNVGKAEGAVYRSLLLLYFDLLNEHLSELLFSTSSCGLRQELAEKCKLGLCLY